MDKYDDDIDPLDDSDRDGGPLEDADDATMDRWARRYEDFNGAPESEEDR